jgi:hypothetical protein
MSRSRDVITIGGHVFHKESKIARDREIDQRTVKRDRKKGAPWLEFAGFVWLEPDVYDNHILSTRTRRSNPPRTRARRKSANRVTA